jgi:uncharacterized protein
VGATSEPSVEAILRRAGLRFAYLFGSQTRGEASAVSDADVAVMPSRPLGLLEQARLAGELARALHVSDVDIVALDRASLELRGRVVQEGRRIYSADEPARVAFEVRTRSEYFDFLPSLRRLERSYLSRVAERGF